MPPFAASTAAVRWLTTVLERSTAIAYPSKRDHDQSGDDHQHQYQRKDRPVVPSSMLRSTHHHGLTRSVQDTAALARTVTAMPAIGSPGVMRW